MTRSLTASYKVSLFLRMLAGIFIICGLVSTITLVYLLRDVTHTSEQQLTQTNPIEESTTFPLGVDPKTKTITEQDNVEYFLQKYFASDYQRTKKVTWVTHLYRRVAYMPWYQSLASPSSRILVIFPGQRKEEIASNFGKILGWTNTERQAFVEIVTTNPITIADGTFAPGRYITAVDATPEMVAQQIQTTFEQNILAHYSPETEAVLPLKDALIIASLIEREGSTFSDMQDISGVIWNRLFIDMKLQLDATLQYARGSRSYEPKWWPVPKPRDKFIDSLFNTYQHSGLPPAPIANPSVAALIAALNPTKTNCLFYFHDSDGVMRCSNDYEEHKAKLKQLYGQGK